MDEKARVIRDAVKVLKNGGVVAFPTETSYGLAADAANPKALARLMRMKGRDARKTLSLIAADTATVKRYMALTPRLLKLATKHWPGPLTVVAKKRSGARLAKQAVREDGTAAIRVSSHKTARALAKGLGRPITATSANVSGEPAAYSIRALRKQGVEADFTIDAGALPRRKPSTLVAEQDGNLLVLRQGSIRV